MRVHDIPIFGVRTITISYNEGSHMYDIVFTGDDPYQRLTVRAYPEDSDIPPQLVLKDLPATTMIRHRRNHTP